MHTLLSAKSVKSFMGSFAVMVNDEMVEAFGNSLRKLAGLEPASYADMLETTPKVVEHIRLHLSAVAPMILAKHGGFVTANEDGEFVECVVGDRATIVCELQGMPAAALIRDMGTREVIGVRVYSAAAIRALKGGK
jgi:hypothetical protein